MQTKKQSKPAKTEEEYTVRTTAKDGHEVIIFERKQQPLRIDGFDL